MQPEFSSMQLKTKRYCLQKNILSSQGFILYLINHSAKRSRVNDIKTSDGR
jgi:hypothetical protein